MDNSQEARRERIRLAKLRRKQAAEGGLPAAPSPMTPVRAPLDSPDVSIVSVSARSAGGSSGDFESPVARPAKRRREEIFMGIVESLPDNRREPAKALLLQLAQHKRVIKEIKQDVQAQLTELDQQDVDYTTRREFLKKDFKDLVEIESRIAERRRNLTTPDLDVRRFAEESNVEIIRSIKYVKDNLANHAAKIMELQNQRAAIAFRHQQQQVEALRQGLPAHPQSLQAMPRYNAQRRSMSREELELESLRQAEQMDQIRQQQQRLTGYAAPQGMPRLPQVERTPSGPSFSPRHLPQMATVRRPQRGIHAPLLGDPKPEDLVEGDIARGIVAGRDDYLFPDLNAVSFEEGTRQLLDHAVEDIEPVDLPSELNVSVLEHQRRGLAWLLKQERSDYKGGVLADDMGLGKTVQTLAIMYANPPPAELPWQEKMTLIVCPLSLVETWLRELRERVHPEHRHDVYVHNAALNKQRINTFHDSGISHKTRVVITTYEAVAGEYRSRQDTASRKPTPILRHQWYRIVLDEAHNIKNPKAKRSEACAVLNAEYRLCLSGTPMQNSLIELWPLLRFLRIKPFWEDIKGFRKLLPAKKKDGQTSADFENTESEKMVYLQNLLDGFLLRRTKYTKINGVPILANLPPKEQFDIPLRMTPDEAADYARFEAGIKDKARELISHEANPYSNMLVLLLRMRQWACHSSLEQVTSSMWAPTPPKQTSTQIQMAREMDRHSVLIAVEGLEANCGAADLDPTVLRACTACGDVMPVEVTQVLFCGHQLCSTCVKSLPEEYPGHVPGSAKCPVCEQLVRGEIVLSLLILVAQNTTTADTRILDMYNERRKNMQALFKRQKEERAAALANLLRRHDESTGEQSYFDSSDDEDELAPTGFDQELKGGPPVPETAVKGEPEGVKGEPDTPAPGAVKGEPEGEQVKDDPDTSAQAPEPTSQLEQATSQSQDPEVEQAEGICGTTLAEKVKARYKVDPTRVAELFHRSNCFENGWVSSTKVNALIETLHDVWASNPRDKVIVFSFFTSFLDVLTIPLNAARIPYLSYSGQQSAEERNEALRQFQTSSTKLLLISLKTGNAGLTLTEANHVFIMEPFWNPYVEEQAKDRVHRIGQRKHVKIYRFICSNTVEERIIDLQNDKMELIEAALKNPQISAPRKLSHGDLLFALGLRSRRR